MKKKTVNITQPETEHFTVQLQTKVHPTVPHRANLSSLSTTIRVMKSS